MVKLLYHYRNRMKTSSGQCTGKGELRKEGSNKAETGTWGQTFREAETTGVQKRDLLSGNGIT
jgi:hypothetical protein